jgi:hypothetical protein
MTGLCDWNTVNEETVYDKDTYTNWRNKIMTYVLEKIDVDFDMLLPVNFPKLFNHLKVIETPALLEVCQNIHDIAYGNPIGTIRQTNWRYIKYEPADDISESVWISDKISEITKIPDSKFIFSDILLYEYWLRMDMALRMVK